MLETSKVDAYIDSRKQWRDELRRLREILKSTELAETTKWGVPCYTLNGKNVVGIAAFKSYVGLWFFQGVYLEDKHGVLVNAQEGRTKGLRQWRFDSGDAIKPRIVKQYVKEAIANAKAGREIQPDREKPVIVPPELEEALSKDKKATKAFADLTKGRQREYADYISGAKLAETKARRLEKILPMIAKGRGLNDKYR